MKLLVVTAKTLNICFLCFCVCFFICVSTTRVNTWVVLDEHAREATGGTTRLGEWNRRHSFPRSSAGWKCKTKASAGLTSSAASLLGLERATSSTHLCYSPQPFPVSFWSPNVRTSTQEFGGDTSQPTTTSYAASLCKAHSRSSLRHTWIPLQAMPRPP